MKNIIISIFDEKFVNYAIRMYKSYRFFDKNTPMYAGELGNLSEYSRNKLSSIGVTVIKSKENIIPENLCMCDLIMKDYIDKLDWDCVMWIDADTIILRPVVHLFDKPFDFIGHGGNIELGFFEEGSRNYYPYKSTWIKREILNNKLVEKCKWGDFFAMGLWVAKNKNIINDFYELYIGNKKSCFEGDICSELINKKYTAYQLNGFEWSIGTTQNNLLSYESEKVVLNFNNRKYYPFQFGYSRIENGERPICNSVEKFYKKKSLLFS